MKKRIHYLHLATTVSLLLLLNGCVLRATVSTLPGALTKDEILLLVSDQTAEVSSSRAKTKALFYFNPNGEFQKIENNWLETGRWKVNNRSLLCVKLEGERSKCRMLKRDELGIGQYVVKKNGRHQREITYSAFYDGKELFEDIRSSSPPLERLQRDEIISLFSNKTVQSKTVKKGRITFTYYRPDGTLELSRHGKHHTGTWRIKKKDRICLKIENSAEKCRIIAKQGNSFSKYIVKKNGQHQRSIDYLAFMQGKRL